MKTRKQVWLERKAQYKAELLAQEARIKRMPTVIRVGRHLITLIGD
jgi:hypothetical protein